MDKESGKKKVSFLFLPSLANYSVLNLAVAPPSTTNA